MSRATIPCLVLCICTMLCCELCVATEKLRPKCPEQAGDRCQESETSKPKKYTYKVDGNDVKIWYKVGSYYTLQCDNVTHSAEHPALPCFPEPVRVRSLTLYKCVPPTLPYARVFAALNVTVTNTLKLDKFSATPPLRADHFEGLRSLERLGLRGISPAPLLPQNILARLPALRDLKLLNVQLGTFLEVLPASLNSLRLRFTETKLVAPAGLLGLKFLSVREKGAVFVNVTGAPALRTLDITSDNSSVVYLTHLPSLVHLHIDFWSETRPEPWVECSTLKHVSLTNSVSTQQTVLPDGWVAHCPVLSDLTIYRVPLDPLSPHLLDSATALKKLVLSRCGLKELPKDLFNDSVQLISLDLSHNRLETLASDLFSPLRALKTLDLSNNMLIKSAMTALSPLSNLKELSLANNMQLPDLCDVGSDVIKIIPGLSPLQLMTGLTKLVLHNTGVSRVCQDWRESMPHLKYLDLTDTNITVLKYEDVVQRRSDPRAKMRVSSKNHNVRLEYSSEDYKRALTELAAPGDVNIIIYDVVACDCNAYWAALAFRVSSRHARLQAPLCASTKHSLRNVSVDELVCDAPKLCTYLQGCSCVLRDDYQNRGGVATAWCEHLGLTTVPSPLPVGPVWHLMLAYNSIASVKAVDLAPHLHELDLRHNAIEVFDKDTAAALRTRKVRLENNPLRCDCDALGLIEIVTRPERIDLKNVTCGVESKLTSLERLAADCAP